MYFIVFFYMELFWVLNINKCNSDFNCNESKYCIFELKMEFGHKKPFFHIVCTQIQKIFKFWADVRLLY